VAEAMRAWKSASASAAGRVRMQLERAGIPKETAKQAIDSVFEGIDDEALIEASLRKRLRGRDTIADDREFQRLFRYLLGQGFESDHVMQALRAKRKTRSD
jgi:SOS response regulatory protein OraA/RecX